MINLNNISKSFGSVKALDNISFEVNQSELFGIIGPDGAGKTTLFRIIATLLLPDSGFATVVGYDTVKQYKDIRHCVGYMPGRFSLYPDLTVEENIKFYATIFGTNINENYELIKDIYFLLEPFKKRRAGALSGGMKQKLALCCALIHKPKVLLLDEPTTGVDPISRKEFWDLLIKLKNGGLCILISTGYMDEASLCDKVALMQDGKILQIDKPQNIPRNFKEKIWSVKGKDTYKILRTLEATSNCQSAYLFGDKIHYIDKDENFDPEFLKNYIQAETSDDIIIDRVEADIEDVFMYLSKQLK